MLEKVGGDTVIVSGASDYTLCGLQKVNCVLGYKCIINKF